MSRPNAYEPEQGEMYQILCRNCSYDREWEHCDYAEDRHEKKFLIGEYSLAYGAGYEFKSILLPQKYWPTAARLKELKNERADKLIAETVAKSSFNYLPPSMR